MKKLLIILSCLFILTGCNYNTNNETKSYTTRNGITFNYQPTWQILQLGLYEQSLDSLLTRQDFVDINFETPHDFGPYGRNVDVSIEDKILKDQTITLDQYLNTLVSENGGTLTDYTSPNGTKYQVWTIENYTFDGFYTNFHTSYTNEEGFHILSVSRLSADPNQNLNQLKPIVDSITLPIDQNPKK
jgi:hypothetical protein